MWKGGEQNDWISANLKDSAGTLLLLEKLLLLLKQLLLLLQKLVLLVAKIYIRLSSGECRGIGMALTLFACKAREIFLSTTPKFLSAAPNFCDIWCGTKDKVWR